MEVDWTCTFIVDVGMMVREVASSVVVLHAILAQTGCLSLIAAI